jgi:hypothetical protein
MLLLRLGTFKIYVVWVLSIEIIYFSPIILNLAIFIYSQWK